MASRTLILVSILGFLFGFCAGQCPSAGEFEPCTCDGEGFNCRRVLESQELRRAFQAYSNVLSARVIYIQGTKVEKLTSGIFGKYSMREFYLDFNKITEIESGSFNGSQHLMTTLSLYSNAIEKFPFQDFRDFSVLEVINLASNRLTSIPDDAFGHVPQLVQILLLNNQISKIGQRAFEGLNNLQNLDLSQNRLKSLGPQSMAFLKVNLELTITLSRNEIGDISPTAFSQNSLPKNILLDRNNMTRFPASSYDDLISWLASTDGYISLEKNLYACKGCDFQWLVGNSKAIEVLIGFLCFDGRTLRQLSHASIQCDD